MRGSRQAGCSVVEREAEELHEGDDRQPGRPPRSQGTAARPRPGSRSKPDAGAGPVAQRRSRSGWRWRRKASPRPATPTISMKKLFDPAQWAKRRARPLRMGHREPDRGPDLRDAVDLDSKILRAQKLWVERARDVSVLAVDAGRVEQGARALHEGGQRPPRASRSSTWRDACRPVARDRQQGAASRCTARPSSSKRSGG